MSVHKDTNNTWYVKYKRTTKRGFETKHEAQIFESKIRIQDKEHQCNLAFEDVAIDYLQSLESSVTYSTYIKCKIAFEKVIIPNVSKKKLKDYTELDCKKFVDAIGSMNNYCSKSKNYFLNKYKAVFKYAVKWYKLQNNPSLLIDNFKESFDEKLKEREKEYKIWNDDEFEKFIACVNNEKYHLFFAVLYYTGMRLGEALALNWNDYHDNCLSISKSVAKERINGKVFIKGTKNISSIRNVSLPSSLCRLLDDYKKKEQSIPGFNEEWLIFGRIKPLPRNNITRAKDAAIKESGVKRITIHQFRHSHASNLINSGMPVIAVSRRLGHSDVNMTLKVYAHLFKESDDQIVTFLEKCSQNVLKH